MRIYNKICSIFPVECRMICCANRKLSVAIHSHTRKMNNIPKKWRRLKKDAIKKVVSFFSLLMKIYDFSTLSHWLGQFSPNHVENKLTTKRELAYYCDVLHSQNLKLQKF